GGRRRWVLFGCRPFQGLAAADAELPVGPVPRPAARTDDAVDALHRLEITPNGACKKGGPPSLNGMAGPRASLLTGRGAEAPGRQGLLRIDDDLDGRRGERSRQYAGGRWGGLRNVGLPQSFVVLEPRALARGIRDDRQPHQAAVLEDGERVVSATPVEV